MKIEIFGSVGGDEIFAKFEGTVLKFSKTTKFHVQFTYVYTKDGEIHRTRKYKTMKTFIGDLLAAHQFYETLPRQKDVKLRLLMESKAIAQYVPKNLPFFKEV